MADDLSDASSAAPTTANSEPTAQDSTPNSLSQRQWKQQKNKAATKQQHQLLKLSGAQHMLREAWSTATVPADSTESSVHVYHDNSFRYITPYSYIFSVYCKGRWFGRCIGEVLELEFKSPFAQYYALAFEHQRIKVVQTQLLRRKHTPNQQPTVEVLNVSADYRLQDGDIIQHHMHRHEPPIPLPSTLNHRIPIIYESDDLVVVEKSGGIPVHACGRYQHNTLVHMLLQQYTELHPRVEPYEFHPVHRLDRLTSGVLIFAKNRQTAQEWHHLFSQRHVQKQYLARVVGDFLNDDNSALTVDAPIAAAVKHLGQYCVDHDRGNSATTAFERLHYDGCTTLVRCTPLTGRTHQIRVHLQHLEHPIANDAAYGGSWYASNTHTQPLPQSQQAIAGCAECEVLTSSTLPMQAFPTHIWLHAVRYEVTNAKLGSTNNESLIASSTTAMVFESALPDWATTTFNSHAACSQPID